jgi:hypothetical protein
MDNRDTGAPEHDARPSVSVQRLPYRSPALVEYGNVVKLTEGSAGTKTDSGIPGKPPT